jgi:hypothetical protein
MINKMVQKKFSGSHHLLLIYDAPKLGTVYAVKSLSRPSQGFFQKKYKSSQNPFCKQNWK